MEKAGFKLWRKCGHLVVGGGEQGGQKGESWLQQLLIHCPCQPMSLWEAVQRGGSRLTPWSYTVWFKSWSRHLWALWSWAIFIFHWIMMRRKWVHLYKSLRHKVSARPLLVPLTPLQSLFLRDYLFLLLHLHRISLLWIAASIIWTHLMFPWFSQLSFPDF